MKTVSKTLAALAGAGALSACAAGGAGALPAPGAAGIAPAAVMGMSASQLTRYYGDPRLDLREGAARKMQFSGEACVLDAYLYAPRQGAEAVVTHVDARAPDGRPVDRAACAAALRR